MCCFFSKSHIPRGLGFIPLEYQESILRNIKDVKKYRNTSIYFELIEI